MNLAKRFRTWDKRVSDRFRVYVANKVAPASAPVGLVPKEAMRPVWRVVLGDGVKSPELMTLMEAQQFVGSGVAAEIEYEG